MNVARGCFLLVAVGAFAACMHANERNGREDSAAVDPAIAAASSPSPAWATSDPGSAVELIAGRVVDPSRWPAVVPVTFHDPGQADPDPCSATIVGPNTLLTAAHCADANDGKGSTRTAHVDFGTQRVDVECTISQPYLQAAPSPAPTGSVKQYDYALCRLSASTGQLTPPRRFALESIDDVTAAKKDQPVLLMGYGCTSAVPGPPDGQLRAADATVERRQGLDPAFLTILTPVATGPALCPGDSGGPLMAGATLASQDAPRRVIGVNAGVGTFKGGSTDYWGSYVTPLATPEFRAFVRSWIAANGNPVVCGINKPAGTGPCHK